MIFCEYYSNLSVKAAVLTKSLHYDSMQNNAGETFCHWNTPCSKLGYLHDRYSEYNISDSLLYQSNILYYSDSSSITVKNATHS